MPEWLRIKPGIREGTRLMNCEEVFAKKQCGKCWRLMMGLLAILLAFLTISEASSATTNVLVASGSAWKYLDDGNAPDPAWQTPSFDDTAWAVGQAQFGYGDGDEVTVLSFGPSSRAKYIAYYFRTTFEVSDPAAFTSVLLGVLRDDGAIVYLNGTEIFRSNMPEGEVNHLTRASRGVASSAERTFYTANLSASLLLIGTNHLAVEVHQESPSSGDMSFDLRLEGLLNLPAITRGPYIQQTGTTNAVIRWRTSFETDSGVKFGTNPAAPDQIAFSTHATAEHEVSLTGLSPGTRYYYSIGTWGVPVVGNESTYFQTAPTNAQPTRIWVIGDAGVQDERPQLVYSAYTNYTAGRHTDVWLMLGDNAYDDGTDKEYQRAVFERFPELLRQTTAWATIGNHDTSSGSSTDFPFLRSFTQPRQGEAGGVASGTERYFSFDHGSIHFICLDAMSSDRSSNGPMCSWLREDLAATVKEWIIAFWHHPPYTKGSHNSDTESALIKMRENAVPILESYGVDLVLCGHSHCYERSYFIQGHYESSKTFTEEMKVQLGDGRTNGTGPYIKLDTGPRANQGTVYVVAGSSGHATTGKLDHPAMYFGELELGSVVIDIDGPMLQARFLRETGAIHDEFTIIKSSGPSSPFQITQQHSAEQVTLSWPAVAGRRYQVLRTTELGSPNWLPASSPLLATCNEIFWSTPVFPKPVQTYYRIVELQE